MKIIINNKEVKIIDKERLRTGNVNTYLINVEYNDIYKDRSLSVYFKNDDIKIIEPVGINNVVKIPHEVLEKPGLLFIGIFSPNCKDNILIDRYCSNLDTLEIIEGAYDKDATYTEELTPNILEQYLQEMRDFYNESLKEYNSNADEKLKEYNDNTVLKLTEYNNNAEAKKNEVDKVALEVSKDKEEIIEIEKRVSASEQNAKTSEQKAQNSANKALESENNITAIYEDINASKSHIDEQKIKVDKSVENVEKLVENATDQARISTEQAELSTTNAGQVSADKTAVENAKNDISSMKTSVEQTKADAEQIKADTQGIYDNAVAIKEETLEAKENVESSLENERIESDKKYARAIESDEIVVDRAGQVELDEDGYMKDVSIESALPEITQETHEETVNKLYTEPKYWEQGTLVGSSGAAQDSTTRLRTKVFIPVEQLKEYYASLKNSNYRFVNIHYYNSNKEWLIAQENTSTINNHQTKQITTPSDADYLKVVIKKSDESEIEPFDIIDAKVMLVEGNTEVTYVDGYPIMPSLDYPSEFQNVVNSIDIFNSGKNILNLNEHINALSNNITILDNNSYSTTYTDSVKWQGIFRFRFENLQKNKDYVISLDFSNNGEPYVVVTGDGETIIEKYMSYYPNGLTFNTNNYKRIQITIYANGNTSKSNTTITLSNIQLEQGKVKTDFTPFLFSDKYNIELSEGQFLGNFQEFKNYIKNDKLKGRLKILTLTGNENWQFNTTKEKTQVFQWHLGGNMVNSIGICSHLKFNAPGDSEKCIVSNKSVYLAINKLTASTVEELKALLAQKYQEGNPVKVLYITTEEFEKDLSLENKSKISSLKVYKGINNIYSNCKIRFKANKNINNYIEEFKDTERNISNNKYSKALKDSVVDKNFAQIYADDSKIDNLVIKGNKICQKVREGYNKLDLAKYSYEASQSNLNNGIVTINEENGEIILDGTNSTGAVTARSKGITALNASVLKAGMYYFGVNCNLCSVETGQVRQVFIGEVTLEEDYYLSQWFVDCPQSKKVTFKLLISSDINKKVFEQYGASPSLEYPSQIETTNAINISNIKENLIDTSGIDKILGTLRIVSQEDGSIKYSGIPAGTWTSLKTINLKTPIKAGTEIIMSYGLNKELKRDNGFNPFLWLLNKNGDSFGTVNKYNIISQKPVKLEQDVYKLVLGIQDLVMDQEYEGQMYIELERTNIMPTEFHKYQAMDYSVNLPEGQFNGAIGDNYNEIKKIDGKWCLVKYIKKLVLNGTEVWNANSTNIGYRYALSLENARIANTNNQVALCTHFKLGVNAGTWNNLNVFNIYYVSGKVLAFGSFTDILSVNDWKNILQEQYVKGTPITVFYTLEIPEIIELPEEAQNTLNSMELLEDLNNISIDNGTISFEYNKPLYKAFEEVQQENINLKTDMQAQIDEIKALLSTTNTASLLAENLAKDNESEVI